MNKTTSGGSPDATLVELTEREAGLILELLKQININVLAPNAVQVMTDCQSIAAKLAPAKKPLASAARPKPAK